VLCYVVKVQEIEASIDHETVRAHSPLETVHPRPSRERLKPPLR
jgi:hypothetical protein